MTDRDVVVTAVRQANPRPVGSGGPDGEWSTAELLAQIEARSDAMATTQRERTDQDIPERRQRRGWLVAAAAFAAVLLIGAVLAFVRGPTEEVVEPTPTTVAPTTAAVVDSTAAADRGAAAAVVMVVRLIGLSVGL